MIFLPQTSASQSQTFCSRLRAYSRLSPLSSHQGPKGHASISLGCVFPPQTKAIHPLLRSDLCSAKAALYLPLRLALSPRPNLLSQKRAVLLPQVRDVRDIPIATHSFL